MEATAAVPVLRTLEDLSAEWLGRVLGGAQVSGFHSEPIGTGQMSQSHRVSLTYADGAAGVGAGAAGPESVVVKLASPDPTSRATGQGLGAYMREVNFYRELAPGIEGPLARAHLAVIDEEGWFTLVLDDVCDGVQGDQIGGCSAADAHRAMLGLAALHAPHYGDAALAAAPWLNTPSPLSQALVTQLLPGFLERYGERVSPEHAAVCERFVQSIDAWSNDARPPLGLVHGDYRLDNMLFCDDSRPPTVVDWQTLSFGPLLLDAAYFIGGSLSVADRREHERELLAAYHQAMVARGAGDLSFDACWDGYRRHCFFGILMSVAASMIVVRTERGDEMFTTMLARYAQQALDLDAIELLPAPGARPPALRPDPHDEGRHPPAAEQLWNESWYFDAVSPDGSLGMYTRLGLYPNLGVAWYTAFVCGPDRPSVGVIDFAAPLPAEGGSLAVRRPGLVADHICEEALSRFRVTLEADGESHEDASAFLRGEPGTTVPVAFDLTFETAGEPYAYRLATRYEIPCTVRGTIAIDGVEVAFEGPGQRDHSWGTRDWWSMDWMWSAGALTDGTRVHAVALRIPGAPPLSVGYVQPPGAAVIELDAVIASEEVGAGGLIERARLAFDRGLPELDVEPLAFGPLRLEAPNGRVSHFPRAMCRLRAADGRAGVGWVEWNRNQS